MAEPRIGFEIGIEVRKVHVEVSVGKERVTQSAKMPGSLRLK